ncbi:2-oxoacid dehydrogenases acyltransferase-domain-containing protein [Dactylonectria estremocensis]|uniref:Dihydrolipoamide acetyltransferase component of pyruvate dehydrogenase complex n=1 Tax=Dactylonectria estremocensis TaxID=1079267 RepID=A0A9P9FEC9_9HYPO|nr:2-oxoacid dehydrogenases acyltransferase-domain-containing protein [Dactylonectria estremocensis]
MFGLRRSCTRTRLQSRLLRPRPVSITRLNADFIQTRSFRSSRCHLAIKPYLLADIGEGITECQIISWEVKEGDEVEEFDPICEVQSDKASVEITSRFSGTIHKLHYNAGDVAKVGSALLDIDVQRDEGEPEQAAGAASPEIPQPMSTPGLAKNTTQHHDTHVGSSSSATTGMAGGQDKPAEKTQSDYKVPLSPIQKRMFESMTKSLSVPHFLYTHAVDLTSVMALRKTALSDGSLSSHLQNEAGSVTKITPLSFVIKALSQALLSNPILNSVLDTESDPTEPQLIIKPSHNIGVAMDTPRGLVVPVIRDVQNHSVASLAKEISRMGNVARAGKLRPDDMKGGTIVVSNIGSIGGHVVAPVILTPMTAIVAVGKVEQVPVFETGEDGNDGIVKRDRAVLSWSADHRVLDGATVARCAQQVEKWLADIKGYDVQAVVLS